MNNLEKNAAKEALKNISYEMLEYANKDELANQVVRREFPTRDFFTL